MLIAHLGCGSPICRKSAREDEMVEPRVILTARERQVLEYMGRGLRNADIANALDISNKTVGAHIRHIFLKLGAQNRT